MPQSYISLTSMAEFLILLTLSLQQTQHFTIHIQYINNHSYIYIFPKYMEDDSLLDDTILVCATPDADASPSTLTKPIVNRLSFSSQSRGGTETTNTENNNNNDRS